jgi:BASS family bile acid:Na+ symporter
MEANFLTAIFLPMALFIIMLGMGLSLTLEDFQLIVIYPKAVVIGLVAQLIMLPIVGFGIASLFPLDPQLAVGVMILAACPGGATSNMITFLAGGDVALSVTLTAISSLITVFTIPLVVNFSMQTFLGAGTTIELPLLNSILQIVVMTLVPVSIGMVTRGYAAGIAEKVDKPVKWLSLFFLAVVIAGVLLRERNNVISYVIDVGLVTLILNLLTMALGFGIATLTRLGEKAARAITVEVGIQNGTLAIAIASSPTLLNTGFAWWASHRQSLSKASTLGK